MRGAILSLVVPVLAAAPAAAQPLTPPALQVLEQQMAQIRFNTARLATRSVLGEIGPLAAGDELGGDNKCAALVTSGTTLLRLAPFQLKTVATTTVPAPPGSNTSAGLPGKQLSRELRIGSGPTRYVYRSDAARHDGGRPWVRYPAPDPKSIPLSLDAFSDVLAALDPAPSRVTADTTPFAGLIEELNDESLSIQEAGPASVDGQQVTEFTATIGVAKLLAKHFSPKQLAQKQLKTITKQAAGETLELEVFIAPDGMPVRTIGVMATGGEGIGFEQDILATGVAVVVHAPPARQTIGAARLLKIEQRRLAKLKRHTKGAPRRQRGQRLPEALPEAVPGSEPSSPREPQPPSQCPVEASL